MEHWFTVEEIDSDTFAISEYKHWEEPHSYLLRGRDRVVLIDSGLGVGNIRAVVDRLTPLPVMVITTHAHWDHIGGHGSFETIAVHELERDWISNKFPISLEAVKQQLTREPCDFPQDFSVEDYQIFQGELGHILRDGERLDLGDRSLTVIHTPGHSPGHCCFYEPERGYLFSGDLIYLGCLDAFYPTTDPEAFYESIKKVNRLSPRRIMPGHHSLRIPTELADRIETGFRGLADTGKLKQGNGIYDFGDFQIHI